MDFSLILVHMSVLLFFGLLSLYSLQYYQLLYRISPEKLHMFLESLRFPVSILRSIWNNDELRNSLRVGVQQPRYAQIARLIISFPLAILILALIRNFLDSSKPNEKLTSGIGIAIYCLGFFLSWRFGHKLKQL
jgi:hypothetical protein